MGQQLLECNKEVGCTAELKSEIIGQTANTNKLLTLKHCFLDGKAEDQHTQRIQEPGTNSKIIVYV